MSDVNLLRRAWTGPAEDRLTAAPQNPMAVARDLANDLFVDQAGALLLRHWRNDFYLYGAGIWREAEDRGIREVTYTWLERAFYMHPKDGKTEWAPTARKVNDVLDALKAIVYLDRRIETPAWLDGFETIIPAAGSIVVQNGILNLAERVQIDHSPHFWAHNSLPFDYDELCAYPSRWLSFLHELWPDDETAIDSLQEIFGYVIGGGTEQQKIFELIGPRRSGKGTIARVLTGLLGRHNVAAPTMASLATNFGLQEMITRPLAIISDARLSTRADSSIVVERLLSISGEDSLTVDRKYRDPWTGRLPTRFLILTNELPKLADSSGALAGRFVLLILTRTFYGRENPRLTDELLADAPGILNWALDGLDRLIERGYFQMPASSDDVIRQMEDLASPIGAFIRQCCDIRSDLSVPVDDLWKAWREWCTDQNLAPGAKAVFGRDLKAAAPTIKRARPGDDDRVYSYLGIGLRSAQGKQWQNARTSRTVDPDPAPEEAHRPSSPSKSALFSSRENGAEPITYCGFNCAREAIGRDAAGRPVCDEHRPRSGALPL